MLGVRRIVEAHYSHSRADYFYFRLVPGFIPAPPFHTRQSFRLGTLSRNALSIGDSARVAHAKVSFVVLNRNWRER